MKVMVTPVSEQTLTNLSVQVRKGAWSGLPAGNDGFRTGVSSWRTQKTCPLESGHCRLEGRSTHPNPCLGGQRTRTTETLHVCVAHGAHVAQTLPGVKQIRHLPKYQLVKHALS